MGVKHVAPHGVKHVAPHGVKLVVPLGGVKKMVPKTTFFSRKSRAIH